MVPSIHIATWCPSLLVRDFVASERQITLHLLFTMLNSLPWSCKAKVSIENARTQNEFGSQFLAWNNVSGTREPGANLPSQPPTCFPAMNTFGTVL